MIELQVPRALAPIGVVVEQVGYTQELIRFDYRAWAGERIDTFGLAGFGRSAPQDMSTLTMVGDFVLEGGLDRFFSHARDAGAPVAISHDGETVRVWAPRRGEDAQLIRSFPVEAAEEEGRDLRHALAPESVLAAKAGGHQLSLFPIDIGLLDVARARSTENLAIRATRALDVLMAGRTGQSSFRLATRAVMGILAALMLRDKERNPEDGVRIFERAVERFPSYFTWWDHEASTRLDLEAGIFELSEGVNYENLDPVIVSGLYEQVLVTKQLRKAKSIYNTPAGLARRLLAALPFENVAPESRTVYDPTCGAGSLLLAGYDRLDELLPATWDGSQRHAYLTERIAGADVDEFAVEIAKLSLLLRAMPLGDSWHVARQNALTQGPTTPARPMFVVANPPWKASRSHKGKRHEAAADYFHRMLDLVEPGGYVGAILPQSLLVSTVGSEFRASIWNRTDLLEVWRLPPGSFHGALVPACAVVVQLHAPKRVPWLAKRIATAEQRDEFYRSGKSARVTVEPAVVSAGDPLVTGGGDDPIRSLAGPRLDSVAIVRKGPVPEPGHEMNPDGNALWLGKLGDLPPYGEPPDSALRLVDYPVDFHEAAARSLGLLQRRKVLAAAVGTPGNPWRLKVGIDRVGVIPRESMFLVVPRSDTDEDLLALMTILGSTPANAWVDAFETKRTLKRSTLQGLPIPDRRLWGPIAAAGRAIVDAANAQEQHVALQVADRTVADAFGLSDEDFADITSRFLGLQAPEGSERYAGPSRELGDTGTSYVSYGVVLAIHPPTVELWVAGLTGDDGVEIRPPKGFLGALGTGAGFEVHGSSDLAQSTYRLQRRAYMEPEGESAPRPG